MPRAQVLPLLTAVLLLLDLCFLPVLSADEAPPAPEQIDAVFAEYDSTSSPGCSLGIYRGGEIVYARGYGMANLEYGIANTPQSVFRIASTSKQFAAMTMALLAEEGKLSLDDDLRQFFPEMSDYGHPVTIRHIVHHTSGLRDYLTLAYLAEWGESYSVEESLDLILRQRRLNFEPGKQWLYSNSNYFLISQIVEKVTGESLRTWAEKHIFAPLGMKHSHFHDDHTRIVPRRASGYSPHDDGWRIDMTTLNHVGDGGVFTTVEDLFLWHQNFADNRLGKGGPELIELVTTAAKLDDGESTGYSFGLSIDDYRGVRHVNHGGAFVGYRANTSRFPDHDLGIAVLCNVGTAIPGRLTTQIADLYLADVLEPRPGDSEQEGTDEEGEEPAGVELSVAQLERFVGSYWQEDDRMFREILLRDGSLIYSRGGGRDSPLQPLGEDRFQMLEVPVDVVVRFEASRMIVDVAGQEPSSFEAFVSVEPGPEEMTHLAGRYYSAELDHVQRLEIEDGELVARHRAGDQTFMPRMADVWTAGFLTVRFQRNEDGEVEGFLLDAGRVRDLQYERR